MLVPLLDQLLERHALRIKAHAGRSIALHFSLNPHEDFAVHRLRASVATPQTPRNGGKQKERKRRNDQQACQVNEVLRVQNNAKYIKAARTQVKQDSLTLTPL